MGQLVGMVIVLVGSVLCTGAVLLWRWWQHRRVLTELLGLQGRGLLGQRGERGELDFRAGPTGSIKGLIVGLVLSSVFGMVVTGLFYGVALWAGEGAMSLALLILVPYLMGQWFLVLASLLETRLEIHAPRSMVSARARLPVLAGSDTGDPALDASVVVSGRAPNLVASLSPAVRRALIDTIALGGHVDRGTVRRSWPWRWSGERVRAEVEALVACAEALNQRGEIEERMADMALNDPCPGVALKAAETLLTSAPEHPRSAALVSTVLAGGRTAALDEGGVAALVALLALEREGGLTELREIRARTWSAELGPVAQRAAAAIQARHGAEGQGMLSEALQLEEGALSAVTHEHSRVRDLP